MAKIGPKFTFKRGERFTGLAAVANPYPYTYIKLSKKKVGNIIPPSAFGSNKWSISIMIKDADASCGWRNASLKAKFDSEAEARAFIISKSKQLQEKFDFHYQED